MDFYSTVVSIYSVKCIKTISDRLQRFVLLIQFNAKMSVNLSKKINSYKSDQVRSFPAKHLMKNDSECEASTKFRIYSAIFSSGNFLLLILVSNIISMAYFKSSIDRSRASISQWQGTIQSQIEAQYSTIQDQIESQISTIQGQIEAANRDITSLKKAVELQARNHSSVTESFSSSSENQAQKIAVNFSGLAEEFSNFSDLREKPRKLTNFSDSGKKPEELINISDSGKNPEELINYSDSVKNSEELTNFSDLRKNAKDLTNNSDSGKNPEDSMNYTDSRKNPEESTNYSDPGKNPKSRLRRSVHDTNDRLLDSTSVHAMDDRLLDDFIREDPSTSPRWRKYVKNKDKYYAYDAVMDDPFNPSSFNSPPAYKNPQATLTVSKSLHPTPPFNVPATLTVSKTFISMTIT